MPTRRAAWRESPRSRSFRRHGSTIAADPRPEQERRVYDDDLEVRMVVRFQRFELPVILRPVVGPPRDEFERCRVRLVECARLARYGDRTAGARVDDATDPRFSET